MISNDWGAAFDPGKPWPSVWHGLEHYRELPGKHLTVGLSGGRSSALQVWHLVQAHGGKLPAGTIVTFENTGIELEATLVFLDQLDRYLCLDLHWLEYDPTLPTKVKRVAFETAARNGEPFEALLSEIVGKRKDGSAGVRPLPNPVQRTCTANLKVKTAHRYLRKHLGWPTDYHVMIGYRGDEPGRVERHLAQCAKGAPEGGRGWFPMFRSGIGAICVNDWFKVAPFNLGIDSIHGNCDLCFMVSTWKMQERMVLIAEADGIVPRIGGPIPARVARWIAWEERKSDRPGLFRKDRPTYRQIWDAVCVGDLFTGMAALNGDVNGGECGSCTD